MIKLPYRIGYWISQADDTGGDEADEAEQYALNNMITASAQELFTCETVQYIMRETVAYKEQWPQWQGDLDRVLKETDYAIKILNKYVDPKEVSGFKRHMITVAEAVALAFCEAEAAPAAVNESKFERMLSDFLHKLFGKKRDQYSIMGNISAKERDALLELRKALDL